jgi:hypothetical protein
MVLSMKVTHHSDFSTSIFSHQQRLHDRTAGIKFDELLFLALLKHPTSKSAISILDVSAIALLCSDAAFTSPS